MHLELPRGDKADILITDLVDGAGAPAAFSASDVLRWTAKAELGRADTTAILTKTSPGGITITVGGSTATIHILVADWAALRLNADVAFLWDLELVPAGVEANKITLASGTGTVTADVTGNSLTGVVVPGGLTCQPWATNADAVAPCNQGVDTAELDLCMQFATDVLFSFTGRKYRGVCTDEVFPNARWSSAGGAGWWPIVGDAAPYRWGFCSCNRTDEYGCSTVPSIRLPGFPVHEDGIVVTIEGAVFTGWELRDRRKLVRTDGEGWPCCQPLPLNDTADGGWSVRYPYGVHPPAAGKRCAAVLGCQLYNAFNPGEGRTCQLPQRVTNIARSGVTIGAVLDPLDLFREGKTGIPSVDMWVASDRFGEATRSSVIVPGRRRRFARLR